MGWSWPELEATPMYVRRFSFDLLNIRRKCDAERQRRGR
jgi:hypothetical protein